MRRALVFAALLCACREKAAQPPPPAEQQAPAASERVREQEPNDFQRAQQIPARALVAGTLQAPRDDDWYRVLRVHAGGDDPGVVPGMACLEACFVKVSGTGLQEYELTVLGGEPRPGEELEPNDRAVDATELRPGSPVRGTFLTADDEDWYRLSLPERSCASRSRQSRACGRSWRCARLEMPRCSPRSAGPRGSSCAIYRSISEKRRTPALRTADLCPRGTTWCSRASRAVARRWP